VSAALGRARVLIALAQVVALTALAAAVAPLFVGRPAPLGATLAAVALSVAAGFALAPRPPAGATAAGATARRRAGVGAALWAAALAGLLLAGVAYALALLLAAFGFTALLAAFAAARLDGQERARALAARSGLAAAAAIVLGAVAGGPLPAPSVLGLVGLLLALVAHAVARALIAGVDAPRVGRSAAVVVAALAAAALALAVGPLNRALVAALGAVWTVLAYLLAFVLVATAYVLFGILRALLHLHLHLPHLTAPPARGAGRAPGTTALVGHAAWIHLGPVFALALAAAVAIWLVGRLRRADDADEDSLFRDERVALAPQVAAGRARRRPPPEGLARLYAQALSILATAADGRVRPRVADTPARLAARAAAALDADGEAWRLFARLTEAYVAWHYGDRPGSPPDPPARVLRALRAALPTRRRREPTGGARPRP
jgi:hypothetical protein